MRSKLDDSMTNLGTTMKEVDLRARALAAASTARFAGFFETAEALMAIAGESVCGRDRCIDGRQDEDTMAWCLHRAPKCIRA